MGRTTLEYGMEMNRRGLKCPAPVLSIYDLFEISNEVDIYRVGKRGLTNVFILVRKGFGTMYVNPEYTEYRKAYKDVFPGPLTGRDVDHLMPRSKVGARNNFIALGSIDAGINRSQNDTQELTEIFIKAKNRDVRKKFLLEGEEVSVARWELTSRPRSKELGDLCLAGYLRPFEELNTNILNTSSVSELLIECRKI